MTRVPHNRPVDAPATPGFDPDVPVEGFYKMRLVSGGVFVGIRIWHGLPLEPWTREEMDRCPGWQVECNGRDIEMSRVWPRCAADPIDEAEYRYLASLQDWGREHAPQSPQANPNRPIDLLSAPLPF